MLALTTDGSEGSFEGILVSKDLIGHLILAAPFLAITWEASFGLLICSHAG